MTEIRFYSFKGTETGFEIEGHSGYAQSGEDIVCAAISSCAYMVANTATEIMKLDAEIEVEDGFMSFLLSQESAKKAADLISGFELHVKALEEQYPSFIAVSKENIEVNNTEVQENA